MSLHQANKDKPRAQKCRHFCFSFDLHNYCPTCREAGKGDDPCVTFETPCQICTSFSDEQLKKIQNRKRYLKKQKAETSSNGIPSLDLIPPQPPPPPPPPPSSTSRHQFLVFKDPSQICPTHPRYSSAK